MSGNVGISFDDGQKVAGTANPLPVAPVAGVNDVGTMQPFSQPGARWNYAAATAGILNTTTAVTIKAAAGVGGTVLWREKVGTAGAPQGVSINFQTPLRGTANTLLEVVTLTASGTGAVYFNAQGYTAA
jgi:hypothetical protein